MDENKDMEMEEEYEEEIVVITDDEGNDEYFREDLVIPVGDKKFAILVAVDTDGCDCGEEECDCEHDDECDDDCDNVIVARMEEDENGETVYISPTDEEFEEVKAAYEKLMEEWDEE